MRRPHGLLVGLVTGALLAGGVAYAVVVIPPNDGDVYYACVSTAGKLRPRSMKLNVVPTSCPYATDTVRAWNAQGPEGAAGPPGQPGEAPIFVMTSASPGGQVLDGQTWSDIPEAELTVTVPAGSTAVLVARVTGVFNPAPTPFSGVVKVRVVVDGEEADPTVADFPEVDRFYYSDNIAIERWATGVPAGSHVVKVQASILCTCTQATNWSATTLVVEGAIL